MKHLLAAVFMLAFVFYVPFLAYAQYQPDADDPFNDGSPLSSGFWYKIEIPKEGIYQLKHSKLKDLGFERPGDVVVYAGAGGMLNEKVDNNPEDGVRPVPALYQDNRILVYAEGHGEWNYQEKYAMFRVKPHAYAPVNTLFLYQGAGSRPEPGQEEQPLAPVERDYFMDYAYHERNDTNLLKSGREWYGEPFGLQRSRTITFEMPYQKPESKIKVFGEAIGRSPQSSSYTFMVNNTSKSVAIDPVSYSYTATLAHTGKVFFDAPAPGGDQIQVNVQYNNAGVNAAEGWLNRITVNAARHFRMQGNAMTFTGIVPENNDGLRFIADGLTENALVWNVTNPFAITAPEVKENAGHHVFALKQNAKSWIKGIVFKPDAGFPEPVYEGAFTGEVANQNIHGMQTPELLIVTHQKFAEHAAELAAFHEQADQLSSAWIEAEAIYNEFSGGKPDAAAIRNLLRMLYLRPGPHKLQYLILFGDGSYDNLGAIKDNTNFLPTYQSYNSLSPTSSFVTDDFYGLLDKGEGGADGELDIGIGRLPVQTSEEAELVINKIKAYKNKMAPGLWRNQLCFAGDDEDGNLFMYQANELAKKVDRNHEGFILKKILLDAYQQETTSSEESYPGASRDLNDQVQNGVLMVNYVGHGAEDKLAEEKLLQLQDIRSWTNSKRLTIFITATCEFSRFDDYRRRSAGEEMLLHEGGGAAALFSTTRLVWAGENYNLNRKFLNHAFEKDSTGQLLRLGDIIRKTKIDAGSSYNKRNFMLLGDPALTMAYASERVHTDSVGGNTARVTDTLGAMEKVQLKGHIADNNRQLIKGFNGIVYASVFDKPEQVSTLSNDGNTPFSFKSRNNLLYKGKATVSNGTFSMEFFIPRDIDYTPGQAKISYYAVDTSKNIHAMGGFNNLAIGGTAENPVSDDQVPEIKLYLNSPEFESGDIINADPVLMAEITDDTGINTTSGIGHGISMMLDDSWENTVMLNNYYEAFLDDYRGGEVEYKLNGLVEGKHSLTLKAWDIANNSAEETISFTVVGAAEPKINNLKNYPNPFHDQTTIFFKHNLSGTQVRMQLRVYDRFGRLIKQKKKVLTPQAYHTNAVVWNGTNARGKRVANGLYFYKVILRNEQGTQTAQSGKMLFMHN